VTNIPDVGTIESTNTVVGFTGPLMKVGVSLWLTHPVDADLNISLISPDGVLVDLSSGNGGGANFGTSCSPDASRTTFDDSAATSITAGSPPFVGTFRPEGSLASLIGGTANGNWRLRVTDNFGGSLGALRCWSLFLYPVACTAGDGFCDGCQSAIGTVTNTDLVLSARILRDAVQSSCDNPKVFPGTTAGSFNYDLHAFTNTTGADACVTVQLKANNSVIAVGYLGSFDPANLALNYIGDPGNDTGVGGGQTFSCIVPSGQRLLVVVQNYGTAADYSLFVSGLPCPPPSLAIETTPVPRNVRVHWPTWAGGFDLQSATDLAGTPSWLGVTNEPIVSGGRFNVTNQAPPLNRFYRLHQP
jgi:hypothetical protein